MRNWVRVQIDKKNKFQKRFEKREKKQKKEGE